MELDEHSTAANCPPLQQDLSGATLHKGKHNPLPDKVAGKCATFQIIRLHSLCKRLDVGKTTVYDWLNPKSPRHDPSFPVPIKLSRGGAIGWIESEVDAWLASRMRAKYNS